MAVKATYLVVYNFLQALGWLYVAVLLLDNYFKTGSFDQSYSVVKDVVGFLLLGAFLEVIHAAVGLVRSGTLNTLLQWLGRLHVYYAVIGSVPELQSEPALAIMLLAWSLIEIIRYPQNALATIKASPRWLVWLRYTAFIPLYPAGVLGEVILMYKALPYIKDRSLHGEYFKHLPFGYHEFLWGVLLVYPFLWLNLYLYLFRQRKARLAGQKKPVKRTSKRE
ncbi:Protein tyrosine phosphatase-like protein PTPLA [Klebsormidium nitens]|uniref:Very-long-chain (3R)-3-hydroxyacyl-CoA dehydratase n=1 Tax=Klebsormidium nitens TaxID=105231 RepID=A0A1Y1IJQ7_KLENI|nr:Protein tyrosine phosphatase-like protein PTPLA [Klebsormidium nitens]|eukprot:GAQ88976.1 Protein tyrosine phosphatase-like protein PTPLA [Klebsormidium nitens]